MKNRTENLRRELNQLVYEERLLSSPTVVKKALELEGVIFKK